MKKETLERAIQQWNLCRKLISFYPPDHPARLPVLNQLKEALQELLGDKKALILGITPEGLIWEDNFLEKDNPVFSKFAKDLQQKGIATLSVLSGFQVQDLEIFLDLLASDPQLSQEESRLKKLLIDKGVTSIKIEQIDFERALREDKDLETPIGPLDKGERQIWATLVSNYLRGKSKEFSPKEYELLSRLAADPQLLKVLVSELADIKLPTFETTPFAKAESLVTILHNIYSQLLLLSPQRMEEVKKEMAQGIFDLPTFLRSELFLAESNALPGQEDVRDILIKEFTLSMRVDLVVSTLMAQEGKLSKRLTKLFHRLLPPTGLKEKALSLVKEGLTRERFWEKSGLTWPNLAQVLLSDSEEEFLSPGYQKTLEDLMEDRSREVVEERSPVLEEYLQSIDKGKITRAMVGVLLELLQSEENGKDYAKISKRLEEMVKGLVRSGEYGLIREILETYHRHLKELSEGIRREAEEALSRIKSTRIGEEMLNSIKNWTPGQSEIVPQVFTLLGPSGMVSLVERLAREEDMMTRHRLMTIITSGGRLAVPELMKRLSDHRWHLVRNVLTLLKEIGDEGVIEHLGPLLKHENPLVRVEMVKVLERFVCTDCWNLLLKALDDPDKEVRVSAALILGKVRDRKAIPFLLKLVQRRNLGRKDHLPIVEAIEGLGELRAEEASPTLVKILKGKGIWNLFLSSSQERGAAAISLGQIGDEMAFKALKRGRYFINREVRRKCRQILREKG